MKKWGYSGILIAVLFIFGCSEKDQKLPYLGNPEIIGKDTVYPKIRPFRFINQDSIVITEKTFENKIYVADFIFLSCPTICPKMTVEMQRIYEEYKNNPDVLFLSHSIDPERDKIADLKAFSNGIHANSKKWFFVTGEKGSIYALAEGSYFSTAYADSTAPGGFIHSGGLLLIDRKRHIRGVYDGTNPAETDRLKKELGWLLKESY